MIRHDRRLVGSDLQLVFWKNPGIMATLDQAEIAILVVPCLKVLPHPVSRGLLLLVELLQWRQILMVDR